MTDEQIIKAYERCFTLGFDESTCYECPFYTTTAKCTEDLRDSALDLINRQKVEIEGLEETRYELACIIDELLMCIAEGKETKSAIPIDINQIKSEVIKEFAEQLKGYAIGENGSKEKAYFFVEVQDIDNLVKEMTEVQE